MNRTRSLSAITVTVVCTYNPVAPRISLTPSRSGWHSMTCHSPPCEIEDLNPDEPWYCQMCPHPTRSYPTDTESTGAPNGITTNRKKKGNRRGGGTLKGKERESDFNLQHEIDVVGDTPQPRSRFYGRRGASRKSSGPPPAKRARLNNNHSPLRPLAAQTPIRIKLKMPPSSPGKENAELEEDFFADVLDVEQRSTIKTAIKEEDKLRFDRSRVIAEASTNLERRVTANLTLLARPGESHASKAYGRLFANRALRSSSPFGRHQSTYSPELSRPWLKISRSSSHFCTSPPTKHTSPSDPTHPVRRARDRHLVRRAVSGRVCEYTGWVFVDLRVLFEVYEEWVWGGET